MVFYLVLLVINLSSIFVCHYMAKNKGIEPVFWGFLGALLGPLAIIFVILAKSKTTTPSIENG